MQLFVKVFITWALLSDTSIVTSIVYRRYSNLAARGWVLCVERQQVWRYRMRTPRWGWHPASGEAGWLPASPSMSYRCLKPRLWWSRVVLSTGHPEKCSTAAFSHRFGFQVPGKKKLLALNLPYQDSLTRQCLALLCPLRSALHLSSEAECGKLAE